MKNTLIDLATAHLWKPIAKNLIVGVVGAATAYVIDRGFFDAQLAHQLANVLLEHAFQLIG